MLDTQFSYNKIPLRTIELLFNSFASDIYWFSKKTFNTSSSMVTQWQDYHEIESIKGLLSAKKKKLSK